MNTPSPNPEAKRVRHDPAEVNLKVIVIFLGIVVVMVVAVFVGLKTTMKQFEKNAEQIDREQAALTVLPGIAGSRKYFPQPTEQVAPHADWEVFKARQDAEMNAYGWIDQKAGVVRLPVARAMELMAQRMANAPTNAFGTNEGWSILNLQQQRPFQAVTNVAEGAK